MKTVSEYYDKTKGGSLEQHLYRACLNGNAEEVAGYALAPTIELHWLADGDHGFRPRAASGRTEGENLQDALAQLIHWLANLPGRSFEARP